MSFKTEDLGKNMVKLTIEVDAADFEKAMDKAYKMNKGKINIPGFRKGKASRAVIEKMYGPAVFYEDAANACIEEFYPVEAEASGLDIVSRPEIDVVQIEKGQNFIFTAEVAVKPEAVLGQYKGLEVEKQEAEVTDEEIDAEIEKVRNQNSRTVTVTDRPVADGDTVNIDYAGSIDGVAFDGGTANGHDLVIGSHSFIDTFEEQLIGHSIGETVSVNVTFPEEYHAEDLKGKAALFVVTINGITVKELPAADDELAKDVSDFDTLEEYKADIKAKILEKKENEIKGIIEDAVIQQIIDNATLEIPQPMVDQRKRQMIEDFAQRLQMQGLNIQQYMMYTGMTVEKMMDEMEPQALKNIQSRLVLEAVAKAEGITVSDEELEAEFESMAKQYGMEVEKIKEILGEKESASIKEDIAVRKAVELVREAAVLK